MREKKGERGGCKEQGGGEEVGGVFLLKGQVTDTCHAMLRCVRDGVRFAWIMTKIMNGK